jgi:hypothetical protein
MQHIDHAGKANGIDGPVCIAVFIIDYFQNASTAKPLQCLGARMLVAVLRIVDRKTMTRRTSSGKDRRSSRDDPIHTVGFGVFIGLIIAIQL